MTENFIQQQQRQRVLSFENQPVTLLPVLPIGNRNNNEKNKNIAEAVRHENDDSDIAQSDESNFESFFF